MRHSLALILSTTLTVSALPALSESNMGEGVGSVAGGVAGYAAAKKMFDNSPVGNVLGAIVGASIGANYGRNADLIREAKLSTDDQFVEHAGLRALQTGVNQKWENPQTGSWGVIKPSKEYRTTDRRGRKIVCRVFEMVSVRNNLPHEGAGQACRDVGQSNWKIVRR